MHLLLASAGIFNTAPPTPVNPVLSLDAANAGSGGSPDSLDVSYSYAGSDTVTLYVVTTSTATPQSEANIIAGSGGAIIQGDSQPNYTGAQVDLDGFTTNTGVTHVQAVAVEDNNGGTSGVQFIALSDFDFTAPVISSVVTNTAGDELTITFDETVIGTNDAADFGMSGHTLSSMAGTGTTRTLSVSPAVANGEVDYLTYTPGDLTNVRGNALAAITGTSLLITNNVPASGLTVTYIDQDVILTDGTSFDFGTKTLGAGKIYVYVGTGNSSGTLTLNIDGSAAALVTDGVTSAEAGSGGRNGRWFVRDITNATGNISATSSVTLAGCAIKWYRVENQTSVVDVTPSQVPSATAPWDLAANVDTVAGGAVLFGWTSGGAGGAVDFDRLTGVTRDGTDVDFDNGEWVGAGSATGVSAETQRSVSLGDTDTSRGSTAVVAISLE